MQLINNKTSLSSVISSDMSQQVDTRKIFIEVDKKPTYYLPGYLRLKVKNFTSMNLQSLDAQMNAALIFTVYYGDLQENLVQVLQKQIILLFGRDDAIKLTQDNQKLQTKITRKREHRQLQFTIRKLFHLRIQSDVFWSPFQIINLILSITVQPIKFQGNVIKINLMNIQNTFIKLSYTEQGTFGNYDLAQAKLRATYTNERVCKVQQFDRTEQQKENDINSKVQKIDTKSKIQHFQYAHFNVPLYKFPIVSIATIFLPLWLLAIINLGIFFQDNSLSNRIASISALMIAFVALIPTIRDQIPPNPKIVFIEILVYTQTLTSLLALINSLNVRDIGGFQLVWYEDGLFLVSFIITILTIVIIVVMMFLHYFVWEKSYNRDLSQEQDVKFTRANWKNVQCDKYFTRFAQIGKKFQVKDDHKKQGKNKKKNIPNLKQMQEN